jgi:HSP20 family protein
MSAITRRTPPFSPFAAIDEGDGLNSLFRRMFNEPGVAGSMLWSPSVEVADTAEAMILTAELPGLSERDITLTLENNLLTIAGEKKSEREVKKEDERYLLTERFYGNFQRSFTLPATVDVDKIAATFDKGVLTVTLPKTPQAKGRVIEVSAKT